MKWLDEQRALYQTLGPLRFVGIYTAISVYLVAFVWLLIWLSDETGWPEAYGSRCHGRGCWPTYLWHSFGLLNGATGYEIALFALLWHLPVIVGSIIAVVLVRRGLNRRRNRIHPMDD
ncbi:hypothetical protein ACFFF7_03235 [Novosphingobium aquiterrae]|uniref:Transmembrane protein n=1 Tax=Novosphingobium aquiterrae TaxID=624388 RepID=A0ABV6PH79_9SPHN